MRKKTLEGSAFQQKREEPTEAAVFEDQTKRKNCNGLLNQEIYIHISTGSPSKNRLPVENRREKATFGETKMKQRRRELP